jgi:two-component system, OmpR family, sensor histidine kinase KdpD
VTERDPPRPNPDALLAQVAAEDAGETRGRLKIFFGAAPGVGKTFAMLETAQAKKREGLDVAVGVLETHGRAETEERMAGLEELPRKAGEFDLDGALERRPQLLLVDELAHTNAEGSRHRKRWQDVEELLGAGIDVYSTLNVQHIESLNDVVAQVTGVVVRETVPDRVLEMASEVELIDLPAPELIERLKAGKVYRPEQAARALENFFRPKNLHALREMALRRTAEKVDTRLNAIRQTHTDAGTWAVTERLLVAVGPGPGAENLVRAGKRFAGRMNAEWMVASVGNADVQEAMHLAGTLGGETIRLTGPSVAEALLEFSRRRNVTTILVGKAPGSKLVDALVENSGDIAVLAIQSGAAEPYKKKGHLALPPRREIWEATAIVALTTLLSLPLRDKIALPNLVMLYLLASVAVAWRHSRFTAIYSSVLGVACFDFFCVPPYLTFAVSDTEYLLTFGVMLAVSVLISGLTVQLREQAKQAVERDSRTTSLYRLARELAHAQRISEAAEALLEVLGARANVFLAGEDGKIVFRKRIGPEFVPAQQEEGIAQWVFDHGQPAGKGAATLPGAEAYYLPLRVQEESFGVLALDRAPATVEEAALLDTMLTQTSQAMQRLSALQAARESEVEAEQERFRNSLLSAVSHDLKTPLAGIHGAASAIRLQGGKLPESEREALLQGIEDESARLGRLAQALLEMSKLEQGGALRKEPVSLEEVVGSSLERMARVIGARALHTAIPEDLPLIAGDAVLLEQAFQNLIENACLHSGEASPIWIEAKRGGAGVVVSVADSGAGFAPEEAPRVFEKFFRGQAARATPGAGLGLAIVKTIVDAHAGRIRAMQRPGGGAMIEFELPLA